MERSFVSLGGVKNKSGQLPHPYYNCQDGTNTMPSWCIVELACFNGRISTAEMAIK